MANLIGDANLRFADDKLTLVTWTLDSSAAQTVFKGQPIIIDQSEDTVNARGFVDATVVAATDIFLGIANEGASVLVGAAENYKIELIMSGLVGFASAVFTNADVGDPVYMSDSGTLSATVADNPEIGVLAFVEDGYAYVSINPNRAPKICSGA